MDIVFPALMGLSFLVGGGILLVLREGALRASVEGADWWYTRFLPRWLRPPTRLWPRRFDSIVSVLSGTICILAGVIFFAFAISAAFD